MSDIEQVKQKVLNWLQPFSTFCFLDNHGYPSGHHSVEWLAGAGTRRSLAADAGQALRELEQFIPERPCWLFGHLGYDLKNEIEPLSSEHPDRVGFPDLFFFEPEITIRCSGHTLEITADAPRDVFNDIMRAKEFEPAPVTAIRVEQRFSHRQYIHTISRLRQHILRGDCYEINFCQEFFAENARVDPGTIYHLLSKASPNPFSGLYRVQDQWLICASPGRFPNKPGHRILSQPIKGTL